MRIEDVNFSFAEFYINGREVLEEDFFRELDYNIVLGLDDPNDIIEFYKIVYAAFKAFERRDSYFIRGTMFSMSF